ncbi:MAG: lysophospholipid acyltransferase family protein [Gammaproteobacteria bacterium]
MAQYSFKKRLKIFVGKHLLKLVVRFLWATCRIEPVTGEENLAPLLADQKAFIPCFWHELLIFGVYYLWRLQQRGANTGFLVSPSADGELGAQLLDSYGIQAIRGSATRTGAQAMQALYTAVKKQGVSPANSPDGPKGPAREFKVGTVLLAQLAQVPLVPVAYAADRAWRLRSWDKFVVPKPFSRIKIVVGQPIYVDKRLSKEAQEIVRQEAETALNNALYAASSHFR